MAVKKAKAKRAPAKKAPAKKAVARRKTNPGDAYSCEVCGLAVTVDEVCGCTEAHELICCSEPMKKSRARK
jgi:hypothetical protein